MSAPEILLQDPVLATICHIELAPLQPKENLWLQLTGSILGQQLSTRVARIIYDRFVALFDGSPAPEKVLTIDPTTLQAIGLSRQKLSYVQAVAAFWLEHRLTDDHLSAMSEDELIHFLTQIKGVGRWTVEMVLLFGLGREDVFAVDDLGIQQGMNALYGLGELKRTALLKRMKEIAEAWKPQRSYACRLLWRYKDAEQSIV